MVGGEVGAVRSDGKQESEDCRDTRGPQSRLSRPEDPLGTKCDRHTSSSRPARSLGCRRSPARPGRLFAALVGGGDPPTRPIAIKIDGRTPDALDPHGPAGAAFVRRKRLGPATAAGSGSPKMAGVSAACGEARLVRGGFIGPRAMLALARQINKLTTCAQGKARPRSVSLSGRKPADICRRARNTARDGLLIVSSDMGCRCPRCRRAIRQAIIDGGAAARRAGTSK